MQLTGQSRPDVYQGERATEQEETIGVNKPVTIHLSARRKPFSGEIAEHSPGSAYIGHRLFVQIKQRLEMPWQEPVIGIEPSERIAALRNGHQASNRARRISRVIHCHRQPNALIEERQQSITEFAAVLHEDMQSIKSLLLDACGALSQPIMLRAEIGSDHPDKHRAVPFRRRRKNCDLLKIDKSPVFIAKPTE
jgi:hypothetical protein